MCDLMGKLTPEQQIDAKNIIDSMFGKTPPCAIVTEPNNLFNSSSLRTAN